MCDAFLLNYSIIWVKNHVNLKKIYFEVGQKIFFRH